MKVRFWCATYLRFTIAKLGEPYIHLGRPHPFQSFTIASR